MKKLFLLFVLFVSLSVIPVHSQSGRKPIEPKPETKTATLETSDNGVTETKVDPAGETVEGDVIRFDTSLVTVPVTVVDRHGGYVPLLNREDFKIFEDGVEQKLAYFATSDQPLTVILVIDTSGS